MEPNKDFKVFNENIEFKLKEIGDMIGGSLPPGWGFTLLLFDFNKADKGSLFYISNADRADMIAMMKEFISLHDQNQPPKK